MIERVEVIRGPMSSLYGSEAMGGVINIITRKNRGEWAGTISSEYTKSLNDVSNNSRQTSLFAGGALVEDLLSAEVNAAWGGGGTMRVILPVPMTPHAAPPRKASASRVVLS